MCVLLLSSFLFYYHMSRLSFHFDMIIYRLLGQRYSFHRHGLLCLCRRKCLVLRMAKGIQRQSHLRHFRPYNKAHLFLLCAKWCRGYRATERHNHSL